MLGSVWHPNNIHVWLLSKGPFKLDLSQFKTLFSCTCLCSLGSPFISHGYFPWLRWDSFDSFVCTPKMRCLLCPDSACLGKYFSPNLQNGICIAMDWRQGHSRVNINNQSCRPPLFGLVSHSGSSEWGGTCRSGAKWHANSGKHWSPTPTQIWPQGLGQVSFRLSEGEACHCQFRSITALFWELLERSGSQAH